MAETPVVDAARVAEIKRAITEGRFQVNPERIADGLLENVRQMLAKQR
jgi:negative regulator of flagellin synthesis FlgM